MKAGRVATPFENTPCPVRKTRLSLSDFRRVIRWGRRIVERQPKLRIYDREYPLRAKVETVNGLSAHADVEDFKWWYEQLASKTGVGQAFLVHGEPESAQALSSILRDYCDEEPIIPELYESFEV